MTIDPYDPTPRYQQLAAILRETIERGELQPGDQLPSEQALIQEHGLARETVRRAIRQLRKEGFVITIQAHGTFVRPEGWAPEEDI